jgi:hypothetical protein
MFRHKRPSTGWQEWNIKYTVLDANLNLEFLTVLCVKLLYSERDLSNYVDSLNLGHPGVLFEIEW